MNLIHRIKTIISSFVNAVLDSIEDPAKLVDQYVRDSENAVNEARSALVDARVSVRRREKAISEINSAITKSENYAKIAYTNNKEEELSVFAEKIVSLKEQLEIENQYLEESNGIVRELEENYTFALKQANEIKCKRDTLKSRADILRLKKVISESCDLKDKSSEVYLGISRLEDKIEIDTLKTEERCKIKNIPLSKADELENRYEGQLRSEIVEREVDELKLKFEQKAS